MDPRLQELIDHHEIRNLLSVYCHGCDRCDPARLATVYADESWDDHGAWKGDGKAFARFINQRMRTATQVVYHHLGQSQIRVSGDEAAAETYFFSALMQEDEEGIARCNQLGGRYVDRLVRTAQGWKIRHRIALRDWSVSLPATRDFAGALSLAPGRRDGSDPSYAALGLDHAGPGHGA